VIELTEYSHCVQMGLTAFLYPFREESRPRHPKFRKKKIGKPVSWFTKAGGDTDLDSVEEVASKDTR
jgi:hypothetical protein